MSIVCIWVCMHMGVYMHGGWVYIYMHILYYMCELYVCIGSGVCAYIGIWRDVYVLSD